MVVHPRLAQHAQVSGVTPCKAPEPEAQEIADTGIDEMFVINGAGLERLGELLGPLLPTG